MSFFKKLFGIKDKNQSQKTPIVEQQPIATNKLEPDPKKGIHTDKILKDFIATAEKDYLIKWFNHYTKEKYYMNDGIYYTAREKINSFDDEYFIESIDSLEPNEIQAFLNEERKHESYLSDKAYLYAMKKKHSPKSEKYMEKLESMTDEKALEWFVKQSDRDIFPYLSDAIYTKIENISFLLLDKEELNEKTTKSLFTYIHEIAEWDNSKLNDTTKLKLLDFEIKYSPKYQPFLANNAHKFKQRGILHQTLGNTDNAISDFQKAIEINPKIGVKKRLQALIKAKEQ